MEWLRPIDKVKNSFFTAHQQTFSVVAWKAFLSLLIAGELVRCQQSKNNLLRQAIIFWTETEFV